MENDRVSPAKLDAYQLVSYELSLCWAECTSGRFILNYARNLLQQAPESADFAISLAALFCAEAVTAVTARLRARPAEFGLADADINTVTTGSGAADFLATHLAADSIAAIGEQVLVEFFSCQFDLSWLQ